MKKNTQFVLTGIVVLVFAIAGACHGNPDGSSVTRTDTLIPQTTPATGTGSAVTTGSLDIIHWAKEGGMGPFAFEVSCENFSLGDNASFELESGGRKTLEDIPAGTNCAIKETNAGGAEFTKIVDSTPPADDGIVTITQEGPNAVSFINDFAKALSGVVRKDAAGAEIERYALKYDNGGLLIEIKHTSPDGTAIDTTVIAYEAAAAHLVKRDGEGPGGRTLEDETWTLDDKGRILERMSANPTDPTKPIWKHVFAYSDDSSLQSQGDMYLRNAVDGSLFFAGRTTFAYENGLVGKFDIYVYDPASNSVDDTLDAQCAFTYEDGCIKKETCVVATSPDTAMEPLTFECAINNGLPAMLKITDPASGRATTYNITSGDGVVTRIEIDFESDGVTDESVDLSYAPLPVSPRQLVPDPLRSIRSGNQNPTVMGKPLIRILRTAPAS